MIIAKMHLKNGIAGDVSFSDHDAVEFKILST